MRGNSRSNHARASQGLVYSGIPQVVFRDMFPDEDAVRAVHKWHASLAAGAAAVDSVTVAPAAHQRHLHQARLKVSGWCAPVEATAESPSLAVHRAFERLRLQSQVTHPTRTCGAGSALHA